MKRLIYSLIALSILSCTKQNSNSYNKLDPPGIQRSIQDSVDPVYIINSIGHNINLHGKPLRISKKIPLCDSTKSVIRYNNPLSSSSTQRSMPGDLTLTHTQTVGNTKYFHVDFIYPDGNYITIDSIIIL